jgi:hypothetical protein
MNSKFAITINSIETWATHEGNDGGIEIEWFDPNYGFGTFQYYLEGGKFHVADDEYMGMDFAQEVLNAATKLEV